jgi:hypothetical protein
VNTLTNVRGAIKCGNFVTEKVWADQEEFCATEVVNYIIKTNFYMQ